MKDFHTRRRAFTLVELLVVISILALLLAILLPSLGQARQLAQSVKCKSNIHQVGTIFLMYEQAHNGRGLPRCDGSRWTNDDGTPWELSQTASSLADKRTYTNAYWGLGYTNFSNATPKLWACPSMNSDDENSVTRVLSSGTGDTLTAEMVANNSYSFNGIRLNYSLTHAEEALFDCYAPYPADHSGYSSDYGMNLPIPSTRLRSPGQFVVAFDGYEPMAEGSYNTSAGDILNNLSQYKDDPNILQSGYWRHSSQSANVLWADGHVSDVSRGQSTDIPMAYFNGNWSRTFSSVLY